MSETSSIGRSTLLVGGWVDLWMEDGTPPEPIRINHVRPLGTGRSELGLTSFHACYPEGVQAKIYRLGILHPGQHQLLAVQRDGDIRRLRPATITRP